MEQWIALLGDICVIIFDLLLYAQMTALRKDTPRNRGILLAGCGLIVLFYFTAVYVRAWPVSVSAFVCMTLPSLALFWSFSKYRDARFFLTFCFVDTLSLVIGYVTRYIGILLGRWGSIVSIIIMVLCFALVYRAAAPYFERYRKMLECITTGWRRLTISTAAIYITMIFTAAYPEPLIGRPEYFLPYLVACVMVVSFYMVFFTSLASTAKVYEQSKQLQEQQKWFQMAYVDALTEIPNRMAYLEKIHELERAKDRAPAAAVIMIDLDRFKSINDTWGHSAGDQVLRHTAQRMTAAFSGSESMVYRIGGDEFAILAIGLAEETILERLKGLEQAQCGGVPYSISYGWAFVNRQEDNAVEQAFSRADKMMYANKSRKKES